MFDRLISFLTCRPVSVLSFCILLINVAACKKSTTTQASAQPEKNQKKIDACALITTTEVQEIQGSPIKDAKSSEHSDGGFRVAQCFYTAETFNKSVSLAVTQADPGSPTARSPKDFWKETFGRYEGKTKKREGEEEKSTPPKKIEGIGDAAYWTANRMGGALYVLKNDVFIRVSVGGPEKEEVKVDHSKALAQKALSRL